MVVGCTNSATVFSSQNLPLVAQQEFQRLCHVRFQSPGSQLEDPQVDHVRLPGRQAPIKRFPGLPEDILREEVFPMAVIAKSARFAQEAVDDVPIVDAVMVGAGDARQGFDVPIGVPDFDLPLVDAHGDTSGFSVRLAHCSHCCPRAKYRCCPPGHSVHASVARALPRVAFMSAISLSNCCLPPGIAPVHDRQTGRLRRLRYSRNRGCRAAAGVVPPIASSRHWMIQHRHFHSGCLRGWCALPAIMGHQLQVFFVEAAFLRAFGPPGETQFVGCGGGVIRLVRLRYVSEFEQRTLQANSDGQQRFDFGRCAPIPSSSRAVRCGSGCARTAGLQS